ncbi:MAG: hypothetical protein M1815_003014 [Lichina confinis]|nr:MAG: hypothetical protein M1815_003014 [Lichina confinis]
MAVITFGLGLFADFTLSPQAFLLKNQLAVTTAPLEILISILYWGLSAIDKKLVLPDWAVIAPLADVGFHAAPSLFLLFDILLLSPPWTIAVLPSIGVSLSFALAYWAYPYPIFEALNPSYRAGLFATSALLMVASTSTLKWLYGRINGFGGGRAPRAQPGAVKET